MSCKSNTATIYYHDKAGKQLHSIKFVCEGDFADKANQSCRQVYFEGKKETEHFCACVPKEQDDPKVEYGYPRNKETPCQIAIIETNTDDGIQLTPKCIGFCDNPETEDCEVTERPEGKELKKVHLKTASGGVEIVWGKTYFCSCKSKK